MSEEYIRELTSIDFGPAERRSIAEVAEEAVRDGIAHVFYVALGRAYENGNCSAADIYWSPCGRYFEVTIFRDQEGDRAYKVRKLIKGVPVPA